MLRSHCRQLSLKLESTCARSLATNPAPKYATIFKEDGKHEKWDEAKPFSEIPGPKSYPVIGSGFEFIFGKLKNATIPEMHNILQRDYGSICRLGGFADKPDMIMCYDPDDMALVYRVEGPWPWRRPLETFDYYRQNIKKDLYGSGGLLSLQGKEWQETRNKINPAMMQPRMVKQYITPVEEVADEFIARVIKLRDSKNEMPDNFSNELNKWALESIARIAMDTRLGCLKDDLKPDSDPQMMIECIHLFFELAFQLEVMPSPWKYIRTPAFTKLMKAFDVITDIAAKYVNAAAKRIEENPNKSTDQESVLEKLLKIDKKVATVMAMDMLFAGVDTTSSTSAILMYYLAKNQKAQDKLREEIRTILPNKDSHLTPEFLNSVPYLKACMKESSRIAPIAAGTARKIPRDIVLSGYQIPAGTEVVLMHVALSNSESQFPRPMDFIPERWLGGRKGSSPDTTANECPVRSAKEAHPFSTMPFGFGPRMCSGKRFAELEMQIFIMKLLRNYRVDWNYGELKYKMTLLQAPAGPLKFKVTEVD